MDGYEKYVASSENITAQIESGRRPEPSTMVQGFETMSSKKDLYDHLDKKLQVSIIKLISNTLKYYVPTYEMFTKDYAKELFQGNKKLLKLSEVKLIAVTKYDELSVKNLYDNFMTLEGMKDFFPDKYPKGRQCDREYMFNIANTLYEEITNELINHALLQRHNVENERVQRDTIMMSDHWKEELKTLPMSISVSILF